MRKLNQAVFLDQATLDQGDLDFSPLIDCFRAFKSYPTTAPNQVVERLQAAEVAISNKVPITADTLAACPNLKLILVAATGMNNVDLTAAQARGIPVMNCVGYGTPAVAQHTLMLLLNLMTHFMDYQRAVRQGRWQTSPQFALLDYPISELSGKTLGIIGYGELGRAVAHLADAFGMRILIGHIPGRPTHPDRLPLEELLPQVDVLSLHCPLTEATHNLIGAKQLSWMKPTAFLLNTARGGIVDEFALAEALRNGKLAGAATDVLTVEPPRDDNPLLAADLPNLIVTPHNAWGSREARQRMIQLLANNAHKFASE